MKKTLQILVLKIVNVLNVIIPQSFNQKIILCYHSIDSSNWEFSTSKADFEEQIKYLKSNFSVVGLNQILSGDSSNNKIAITFDDGYETFSKNALPIIKKYDLPVTLFVVGSSNYKAENNVAKHLPLLKNNQLKDLNYKKLVLGYHTQSHEDLTRMSKAELEKEIILSKKIVEKELNTKLQYFAYPLGKYSNKVVEIVKLGGYKAAFTTKSAFLKNNSIYEVPRYCVGNNTSIGEFKKLITPLGMIYSRVLFFLYNIKRTI